MTSTRYDAIVVGSGAGGAAATYRLVNAGLNVLLLEKGAKLADDGSTLDVDKVVLEGRFKSREAWRDGAGRPVVPEEYFNLGGKTKWYGAALLRFSPQEFLGDERRGYRGWPIDAAELVPYYDEVETLLGVREFDCEPDLEQIVNRLKKAGSWRTEPLPMGLSPDILAYPEEARHFDGFASVRSLKSDAESAMLGRVMAKPNLTVITDCEVTDLMDNAADPRRIEGVICADGRMFRATRVLLACGALHSPRILQRYVADTGLASSLPAAANIGRNLKLHLLTALLAVSPGRKQDLLRKTTLLLNARFPNSSVQPLGFDGELIAGLVPSFVPRRLARMLGERAYGFFLQTEDASHEDNRIAVGDGDPLFDYSARRSVQALAEHRRLVVRLSTDLLKVGYLPFSRRIPAEGTAHACGTLVTGHDPATSVVAADGAVHGLSGLYVVDGSVLPRSSRVNPSLTIYAWGLRVADGLLQARRAAA